MSFKCLQDGLLDFRYTLAQKLLTGRTQKFVSLMMKIINIHHLHKKSAIDLDLDLFCFFFIYYFLVGLFFSFVFFCFVIEVEGDDDGELIFFRNYLLFCLCM